MMLPTRGQRRAYVVLCAILTLALLLLVFVPRKTRMPEATDHSRLEEAIARFGDGMSEENDDLPTHKPRSKERHNPSSPRYSTFQRTVDTPHKPAKIELNTADTTALMSLPGIGPVFARRIVKYRDLLGGYARKEQLLDVYGMSQERYQGMLPYIVIDTNAITKISINSATLHQLRQHPYLDYYQAKAIVNYRNSVGVIHSAQEMMMISILDETTVKKILPYIQFN